MSVREAFEALGVVRDGTTAVVVLRDGERVATTWDAMETGDVPIAVGPAAAPTPKLYVSDGFEVERRTMRLLAPEGTGPNLFEVSFPNPIPWTSDLGLPVPCFVCAMAGIVGGVTALRAAEPMSCGYEWLPTALYGAIWCDRCNGRGFVPGPTEEDPR